MTLRKEQIDIELKRSEEAVTKKSQEILKAIEGDRFADTSHGKLLMKLSFEDVKLGIDYYFEAGLKGHRKKTRNLIKLFNDDSAGISYIVLTTLINKASNEKTKSVSNIAISIMKNLLQENKVNRLKRDNPKLHTYLGEEFRRASKRRKEYLIDKHLAYLDDIEYDGNGRAELIRAGTELIEIVLVSTNLFKKSKYWRGDINKRKRALVGNQYQIGFTEEGNKVLESIDWVTMAQESASMLPMIVPPEDWTTNTDGGYLVNKKPLLSVKSNDVQKWQKRQDFSKIYPVVNKLQQTAWRVNDEMLDLIQDIVDEEIIDPSTEMLPVKTLIGGLPTTNPARWYDTIKREDYAEEDWALFNRARERQMVALDSAHSKRIGLQLALGTAHTMRDYEEFYYTYQLDYRGRIYPVSSYLSHQGQSYSKAILEFAEGRYLTEEGLFWLKIHIANVFGNDKMEFDDRIKWFEENRAVVLEVANNPLECKSLWIGSDSPFEYVAACKAYKDHIEGRLVHTPIQLDAICSGISIYSGLLLDKVGAEETAIINKYDRETGKILRPDIYKTVAGGVNDYLVKGKYPKSFEYKDKEGVISYATAYKEATSITGKVTRSIVKRPTMTVPYSVTMRGMSDQLWDVLDTHSTEGTEFWEGEKWIVNKLLTDLTHKSIYATVKGARIGQEFLVSLSKLVKKQAEWVTPLYSFPIKQTSLKTRERRVQTILGSLMINIEVPKLDTRKQSSSIAPNFIHSLDSEILKYCIDKMDKGIGVIHDCVIVHPNDGYQAQDKYREGYVKLMELHPLEHISKQLDPDGKLKVPDRGELNLKDVYKSKYIIS